MHARVQKSRNSQSNPGILTPKPKVLVIMEVKSAWGNNPSHSRTPVFNVGLFQPITWMTRRRWGHLRAPWCMRQGASEERKKLQIWESLVARHTPPISQFHPDGSQPWEPDLRTAARRNSCSAKLRWFLLKTDFEVVLRSKTESANPASLAPTSPRQAGYYYYLLFVGGYSKPSVRSSPGARKPRSNSAGNLELGSQGCSETKSY